MPEETFNRNTDASAATTRRYAPWRGGHGGVRMGLTPINEAEWLVDPTSIFHADIGLTSRRAAKAEQYGTNPTNVYGVIDAPSTHAAINELCVLVKGRVSSRGCWSAQPRVPPLIEAALNVAEDLCVLLPKFQYNGDSEDTDYALVAAALFAPSFWRLAEKLGAPLRDIHSPVASLESKLGTRMRAFLKQLPAQRIFTRGNWNLHFAAEQFHPHPDGWHQASTLTEKNIGELLCMRSERQTLMKLPNTGAMVFTILVFVEPLNALLDDPTLLADVWQAYQAMPDAVQKDRHFPEISRALHGWLTRHDVSLDDGA